MRARNIKPGFFKNEDLAELPPLARLLYAGLWCYADREGKFEWRPKRIKAEILPYDNCDITKLLMSLHSKKFIYKYVVNGEEYGIIPKFNKHQSPHKHEAKSTIPDPPKEIIEQIQCLEMSNTLHEIPNTSQEMYTTSPADSLIPDSLIPDSLIPDINIFFDEFWNIYPTRQGKKQGKKECLEFFKKRFKPDSEEIQLLLKATKNYSNSKQVMDGYAKDPIRFLKKDFWRDWIEPPEKEINPYLKGLKKLTEEVFNEKRGTTEVLCLDGKTGNCIPRKPDSGTG
ncbi:MAG: hypothetical protein QW051_04520 [Candidatus Aenigmatarchaeota archaeon]